MNEPDYGRNPCTQEGMRVPPDERAQLVRALAEDLRGQAPYAGVIADESSQVIRQLIPESSAWLPQSKGDLLDIAPTTAATSRCPPNWSRWRRSPSRPECRRG